MKMLRNLVLLAAFVAAPAFAQWPGYFGGSSGGCVAGSACTGTTVTGTVSLVAGVVGSATGSITVYQSGSVNNFLSFGGTASQTIYGNQNTLGVTWQVITDTTGSGGPGAFRLGSTGMLTWQSATGLGAGSVDTALCRSSAQLVFVSTSGTTCNAGGSFQASNIYTNTSTGVLVFGNGSIIGSGSADGKFRISNNSQNKYVEMRAIVPVIGTCGSSPSVAGTDTAMVVTVGTGGAATTCGVTFSGAYTNAPACTAQSDTDVAALSIATTTTTLTVTKSTAFTASSKLHIHCLGYI